MTSPRFSKDACPEGDSQLLRHEPCADCGSSDGLAVYDDGHSFCFVCRKHTRGFLDTVVPRDFTGAEPSNPELIFPLTYGPISSRGITEKVCRSHGYGIGEVHGNVVQVANYRDASGEVVGQKIKSAGKQFSIRGSLKPAGLWQQHRWPPGKKHLIITEGETDCLAWQSISGDRFAAVSIPNGAAGAVKAIKEQIEYVESFDRVVLCFDADTAGRKATEEVSAVLRPGKCCIMQLPDGFKDICEVVAAGQGERLISAFWNAQPKRPDGIVSGGDLLDALLKPPVNGIPYPWKGLTEMLRGLRRKELVTLTAGTGVGKSHVAGLIAHSLISQGFTVGYISLEESLTRTVERLVGAHMRRQLHVSREGVTEAELEKVWNEVFDGRVVVYNHFGSTDAEQLMNRVRYMRIAESVDFVIIDHLSILVSGWGDGDERRLIDNVMTNLRSICEQTEVGMLLISHLRSPENGKKTHEEGGRPKLSELRGSKAISQLSDGVIAIVRNQMAEDPHTSEVWVLKNRHCGVTGRACTLKYDPSTGTMDQTNDELAEDSPF